MRQVVGDRRIMLFPFLLWNEYKIDMRLAPTLTQNTFLYYAKHVFILKDIPLLECSLSFKLFVNMQEISLYWFAAQYQAVTFRQKKTCFA